MSSGMQTMNTKRRQGGIGLVEIMISLTLGLLVTGAIVQIYLTTKRQSDMQTSLTGRQEAARFVAQIIQRDAQMAGYRGCLRDVGTVKNTLNTPDDFLYDYGQHVVGFDNVEDAADVPDSIEDVVADTDVLTVRTVDDLGVVLTAGMATSIDDPVTTAGLETAPVKADDIVLVADCSGAAVFQVKSYNKTTGALEHTDDGAGPGNLELDLGRRFGAGAQLFRVRTTTYFIRESDNGTGPALWRRVGLDPAQELAEGIENMQVLYGVDTDTDQAPDEYRTAADVGGDWGQVVSLQVALLAAGTKDRVADPDDRTFDLVGEVVDPPADGGMPSDGRLRRALTFTVAMRNRLS